MTKLIYIAGPWVFRKDAQEYAEHLRSLVEREGFKALIPIDNECTSAFEIKMGNIEMIKACDYVIADITPFRGPSCDVGTAYEIGYAECLGKGVVLWSSDRRAYKDRVVPDDMNVEDFNLCDNLMIQGVNAVWKSFEKALEFIVLFGDEKDD